jgi:hypothetical protein
MKVEIIPMVLKTPVRVEQNTYIVDQPYDHARVMVDGQQIGLTMTDPSDKFHMILHPLSGGYPREFLELVVKNSAGQLKGTLDSPKPLDETQDEDDE